MELADARVFSPGNVWVFSRQEDAYQHYNGHTWQEAAGLLDNSYFFNATATSASDLWVIGSNDTDGFYASVPVHGAGNGTWTVGPFAGFPDGPGHGPITFIYAQSATDVWAAGGIRENDGTYIPLGAQYNGSAWTSLNWTATGFMLASAISDGQGGLWASTAWDATGVPPHLLHYTAGTFTPVPLPRRNGRYVAVTALAAVPGSVSRWAVGKRTGLFGKGRSTGVILSTAADLEQVLV